MIKMLVSLGGLLVLAAQAVAQEHPAYIVAEVEVTDQATYQKYIDGARPIVEKFGGHFLSRGNTIEEFAGLPPKRVAIYEFPSMKQVEGYRDSPEYKAIVRLRDASSKYRAFIVNAAQ
jgi:uncharacterized protein (DUF1330 family)